KAELNALFGDAHETLCALGNFSHLEHAGSVREISVKNGGHVDIDDISLFQDDLFVRDTVADLIVDGGAHAFREALVVQGGGDAAVFYCKAVDDLIDLGCTHADADMLCDFVQDSCVKRSALFDLRDLRRSLKELAGGNDLALFRVQKHFFF